MGALGDSDAESNHSLTSKSIVTKSTLESGSEPQSR